MRSRNSYILLIFSALVLLSGLGARRLSDPERIAFISFRPGNWDIYYHRGSGGAAMRLTDHPSPDYDAIISPDGRYVLFCSERGGSPDLFVIEIANPNQARLLVESEAMEDQASFSPDGKSIAFVSTQSGNAEVYVLPFQPERTLRMSDAVNLTARAGGDFRPAFSPDGKWIAFSSDRDAIATGPPVARQRKGEIYVMRADGTEQRRITNNELWNGSPSWSSDGSEIRYSSARIDVNAHVNGRGGVQSQIFSIRLSDNSIRALTRAGETFLSPASAGNGQIAFAHLPAYQGPGRGWKVLSMRADGTNMRVVSDSTISCWSPTFHPGSRAMVCHGPGPPAAGVKSPFGSIGQGPLLASGSPFAVSLPDRALELYAIRGLSAAIHPRENLLAWTSLPGGNEIGRTGPRLSVSRPDGDDARLIHVWPLGQDPVSPLAWSPDGNWLAFVTGTLFGAPSSSADVFRIRADGSEQQNLTPDSAANDGFPDYSGDGKSLVIRSGRTGNHEVFLIAADGKTPAIQLTDSPANDTFPAFSPSNNEIVFSSNRDTDGTFDLYSLKLTEDRKYGELKRLTNSKAHEAHARFSPDGKWIVFTSERGGMNDEEPLLKSVLFSPQAYGEIYALRLSDGFTVRISHNKWEDGTPSWGK